MRNAGSAVAAADTRAADRKGSHLAVIDIDRARVALLSASDSGSAAVAVKKASGLNIYRRIADRDRSDLILSETGTDRGALTANQHFFIAV